MSSLLCAVRQDWAANRWNVRIMILLTLYRSAHVASMSRKKRSLHRLWADPLLVFYRFITEWIMHLELPAATQIGCGLIIDHGYGIVVNKSAVIGAKCRIRQNVTIGCKLNADGSQGPSPQIGDNVEIGAGAIIVGGIRVGSNVKIGAGAVVVRDVPDGGVVVGNPARLIRE